jgi:hypothetical protein
MAYHYQLKQDINLQGENQQITSFVFVNLLDLHRMTLNRKLLKTKKVADKIPMLVFSY